MDHQITPPEAGTRGALLPLRAVNRDKWGPWLWGTLRLPGYGAPRETGPVLCPRCGQRHGLAVQECLLSCPSESRFWDIWTDAWETWKPEATKWRQTASANELRMCTRLQFPHSLQRSFLPVQAHWRVVVATWHFHVFQRLQAWVVDKLQHAPTFVSNKRPTHIVPPVAGALPQVAKPTARNIWNHVRGVLSIPPRSKPRFTDTAPTVEELRWQLTQAVTTAESTWVLEAVARHHHVAPPRKRPRELSPPPAQAPASPPRESREIHAGPFLEQARRVMLHAQMQAARLCLEEVAQALARQAVTQKSLFLAHHHEHLCRQAYFLYKEHTTRWYVEAQQAVYHLSWMADSRRLRFRQWRTAVLLEARSTVSRKLAVASSCWKQAHVSLSTGIQAEEASEWRHMSQVHAVTLTALRRTTLSDPRWDIRGATAQRMKRLRDENPPETHKKRRAETPEVPSDLQDMEIPLEDMGDVIVLTGL